jgi:hypothetical protein
MENQPNPNPNPPTCYRMIRISDPRSRGACYWFEIESITADGRRAFIATAETRAEARDLIRRLESAGQ